MSDIQIHELGTFSGTPGEGDGLAIDNGEETSKVEANNLGVTTPMTEAEITTGTSTQKRVITPAVAATLKALVLSVSSFSSLPKTVTNSKITSDMVVLKAELGTPSAQTADWTVTTSNGSLQITGTNAISGSTTLKLYLMKSR